MSDAKDLRAVSDRIEALLQELGMLADARAREKSEELVRLLMELYGAGLARMLEIVDETETDETAVRLFHRFADDSLVASLLVLHGLHPLDVESRIQQALERVRPYLGSHGGDVNLLGVRDGVVRLRLEGSCHGCASSTVTMRLAIERAIEEAAPEVTRIEVEGVTAPAPVPPLHQIGSRRNGAIPATDGQPSGDGWVTLDETPKLAPGELAVIEVSRTKVIVCRSNGNLYAYRDSCPSCGSSLTGGTLREDILACPSCERRYSVRLAGRCVDAGELHLEPLPLLREQGTVKVAVPASHA